MKRFKKIIAVFISTAVMAAALGFLGYFVYRRVTVDMALSEAQRFKNDRGKSTRRGTDPAALAKLRPHPWSSPLNDRQFDEAIAGASAAYEAADYDRAIALNTRALEIKPSKDLVWLLLRRRGNCYLAKNEPDRALADYDEAAKLGELDVDTHISRAFAWRLTSQRQYAAKEFDAAIALDRNDPDIYFYRAGMLVEDGNLDAALADYTKALELNPRSINSRVACAEIYVRQHESQKAITQATIALQMDKYSARAHVSRARAYTQLYMSSEARADLDAAMKSNSLNKAALNTVAWCLATCPENTLRDGKKAVSEATKACELDQWKNWGYIDTLAAACAEAEAFDKAVTYEGKALQMVRSQNPLAADMRKRMELYKQHKKFREGTI
jgi:tetratricopeptide (TPR) repeat protein